MNTPQKKKCKPKPWCVLPFVFEFAQIGFFSKLSVTLVKVHRIHKTLPLHFWASPLYVLDNYTLAFMFLFLISGVLLLVWPQQIVTSSPPALWRLLQMSQTDVVVFFRCFSHNVSVVSCWLLTGSLFLVSLFCGFFFFLQDIQLLVSPPYDTSKYKCNMNRRNATGSRH